MLFDFINLLIAHERQLGHEVKFVRMDGAGEQAAHPKLQQMLGYSSVLIHSTGAAYHPEHQGHAERAFDVTEKMAVHMRLRVPELGNGYHLHACLHAGNLYNLHVRTGGEGPAMSRRELHKSVKTDFKVVPMPPIWGIDVLVFTTTI